MALIYETANFILETREKPFIDRAEGGHIRIMSTRHYLDVRP